MSLLAWIALAVLILSLLTIGWLLLMHWGDLRLLDPMTIKEERQKKERQELMNRRFERVSSEQAASLSRAFRGLWKSLRDSYRSFYRRLRALDASYKKVKNPLASMAPSQKDRVTTLINEAKSLARDTKWAEAERRYLDVLQIDPRSIDAYKGIGQIYLKQKLYPQAKETLEFLLKTKKTDDTTFACLAEIAEVEGDMEKAEVYRVKAAEASPNQAFRHAELAQFYLARKRPDYAWGPAERAIELEKQSVKFLELAFDVAIANRMPKEARELYQRLRIAADDADRASHWKEKLEQIEESMGVAKDL